MKTKQSSLLSSVSIFSLMTFISRIFGFIRDIVIASVFGANYLVDAFSVAFKIPNFMRRLVAEGAFTQAFLPILSEYQKTRSELEIKQFTGRVGGTLAGATFTIAVIGMLCAPILVSIFAPGFFNDESADRYFYATNFLRVTFPYLFFISLTAYYGAILNAYGYYAAPAFAPVWLNISMILGALYLSGFFEVSIWGLVWGVCIAGIAQFIFLLFFIYQKGLLPKFRLKLNDPGVIRILGAMVPALLGVSVAQLNLMMDTIFASFLVSGSVSWLYYSDRLVNFPLGIMGVALSTVTITKLSRSYASKSGKMFSSILHWSTQMTLLSSIPSMFGLAFLASPILLTLFFRGNFTEFDVLMTSKSLVMFSFGLPAFMLVKILASAFYAQKDYKTPVKVGMIAILVNFVLNLILIKPLAHAGLALSTSIAGYVNAILLLVNLRKTSIYLEYRYWNIFISKMLISALVMGGWLYAWSPEYDIWMSYSNLEKICQLLYLICSSVVMYTIALIICGFRYADIKGEVEH